jgi:transcriptional regulator with XRE-family HTH domain
MNDAFIMMTQKSTSDSTRALLASNLRRLRIARNLSISQLARDTSMSKATLSGIESGRGNPTVDTLTALAGALGASIADLLESPPIEEVRIVRAAEVVPSPPDRPGGRPLESLRELDGGLEILELALAPNELLDRDPRAGGSRDGVFVLQGKLIAGPSERISELASGDYASFPADVAHLYETTGTSARALVLLYTPR